MNFLSVPLGKGWMDLGLNGGPKAITHCSSKL